MTDRSSLLADAQTWEKQASEFTERLGLTAVRNTHATVDHLVFWIMNGDIQVGVVSETANGGFHASQMHRGMPVTSKSFDAFTAAMEHACEGRTRIGR